MKRPRKKPPLMLACLILTLFAAPDFVGNTVKPSEGCQPVETASFCELANHPERYVNKPVRTSAIFLTHFPDVWFMYDEHCSDKSSRVVDTVNCKSEAECDRLRKLSSQHREGDGERLRNRMAVAGRLQIVERQNRSGGPTRVLKFEIDDIQSVSAVPESVPWP